MTRGRKNRHRRARLRNVKPSSFFLGELHDLQQEYLDEYGNQMTLMVGGTLGFWGVQAFDYTGMWEAALKAEGRRPKQP